MVSLLFFHLPQEAIYSHDSQHHRVDRHGQDVRPGCLEVAPEEGSFQFNGMDKGQKVCDFPEGPAYQLQIEPHSGKPGREVRQQCAADATHLLDPQQAAAEQTQGDVEHRHGKNTQNRVENLDPDGQSQRDRKEIADRRLPQSQWEDREHITQDKIDPLQGIDFILGYMLPILPLALGQAAVCYLFAIPLGLSVRIEIFYAVLGILPMAVFNIALGLLCGSLLGVKQVGGICGALLTNLSAWFSGVWFDLELVGGTFRKIADLLPFVHAVELERALFRGDFQTAGAHILPVAIYAVVLTVVAVYCFLGQMKKQ